MTKLLTLAATLVALTGWSATNNLDVVSFAWDPVPDTDPIDYTLYFSKNTNVWTHVKATTLSTATVELPSQGLWYFIVTSWASRAADGTNRVRVESLPSNMVSYQTPQQPGAPGALRLVTAIATRVSTITVSSNIVYAP